jgi:hypothetical protein
MVTIMGKYLFEKVSFFIVINILLCKIGSALSPVLRPGIDERNAYPTLVCQMILTLLLLAITGCIGIYN